jgi:hypothetical protein
MKVLDDLLLRKHVCQKPLKPSVVPPSFVEIEQVETDRSRRIKLERLIKRSIGLLDLHSLVQYDEGFTHGLDDGFRIIH